MAAIISRLSKDTLSANTALVYRILRLGLTYICNQLTPYALWTASKSIDKQNDGEQVPFNWQYNPQITNSSRNFFVLLLLS